MNKIEDWQKFLLPCKNCDHTPRLFQDGLDGEYALLAKGRRQPCCLSLYPGGINSIVVDGHAFVVITEWNRKQRPDLAYPRRTQ